MDNWFFFTFFLFYGHATMSLHYLDFDHSEGGDGNATWDAMASVPVAQWSALLAEVAQVLTWAHQEFGAQRGPLENGADWDYDLQGIAETVTPQHLRYNEDTGVLRVQPETENTQRYTLSLALSGTPAFSAALQERFGLE